VKRSAGWERDTVEDIATVIACVRQTAWKGDK